jgi:hypothetical protein
MVYSYRNSQLAAREGDVAWYLAQKDKEFQGGKRREFKSNVRLPLPSNVMILG